MRLTFGVVTAGAAAITMAIAACTGSDPMLEDLGTDDAAAQPGGDSGGPTSEGGPSSDASDAGADSADADTRFCDTQTKPAGATDFLCADFDGTKLDEGFSSSNIPDGGAITAAHDLFHSPPTSLQTSNNATLEFDATGALPLTSITATFQVNVGMLGGPVAGSPTGEVRILVFDTGTSGETQLALQYTAGGFEIGYSSCPSACLGGSIPIGSAPAPDVWTRVTVTWTSVPGNGGTLRVLFNDDVVVADQSVPWVTTTHIATSLGLVNEGDAPPIPRYVFDDVVISARR